MLLTNTAGFIYIKVINSKKIVLSLFFYLFWEKIFYLILIRLDLKKRLYFFIYLEDKNILPNNCNVSEFESKEFYKSP
jgi:hypothetical protein